MAHTEMTRQYSAMPFEGLRGLHCFPAAGSQTDESTLYVAATENILVGCTFRSRHQSR